MLSALAFIPENSVIYYFELLAAHCRIWRVSGFKMGKLGGDFLVQCALRSQQGPKKQMQMSRSTRKCMASPGWLNKVWLIGTTGTIRRTEPMLGQKKFVRVAS